MLLKTRYQSTVTVMILMNLVNEFKKVVSQNLTEPSLSFCRFLGTYTDVAIEDLHIHGKIQLVLLFNQNIPFPHVAAVSLCFTEE